MGNKKTFENRIKESEVFIEAGDFKSAISTLKKAESNNPIKAKEIDLKAKIEELQKRLAAHIKAEEKPDENITDAEPPIDEKPEEQSENDELEEEISAEEVSETEEIVEEETEEKPDEDDLDPDEIIEFKVIRTFIMNQKEQVTGTIVKLPRRRKNFDYVVALEDLEDE